MIALVIAFHARYVMLFFFAIAFLMIDHISYCLTTRVMLRCIICTASHYVCMNMHVRCSDVPGEDCDRLFEDTDSSDYFYGF